MLQSYGDRGSLMLTVFASPNRVIYFYVYLCLPKFTALFIAMYGSIFYWCMATKKITVTNYDRCICIFGL